LNAYDLDDLLKRCEGYWHDVAIRMNELKTKAFREKKAQAEREAKKHAERQQQQQQQEAESSASEIEDEDEDEEEDDTKASLKKANSRIKRLERLLEDAIAHGQLIGEPRPLKKRPPTVALQKFKGVKKDYARFKQAFKDAFEEVGLSDISLAINLNEHLEGEPRSKLAHLVDSVTMETYQTMWKCLDTFYGDEKEKEVEKFLKFESMPHIRTFNAASISILITALESNWTLLKKHSKDAYLSEDNIHLVKLLKKIPLSEKDRFLDYCHYSSKKATLPVFKKWLTERWHRLKESGESSKPDKSLQYWQDDLETSPATQFFHGAVDTLDEATMSDWKTVSITADSSGTASLTYEAPDSEDHCFYEYKDGKFNKIKRATFNTKLPNAGKVGGNALKYEKQKSQPQKLAASCHHCSKQGHYIQNCDLFTQLSVDDKYKSVRDHKLCLRCLNVGHIAKDCKVKFVCDVQNCGKRHHRLLHPDRLGKRMYQAYFVQGLDSDVDSEDEGNQH
jgi:hypothetical protein